MTKNTTDDTSREVSFGLCHCGCGQKTNINPNTKEPYRFVQHHGSRKNPFQQPNPSGYCMCGCGQKTEIARHTRTERGWVRGKPKRFVNHHHEHEIIPLADKFWSHVIPGKPDECWPWQGVHKQIRHVQFRHGGKRYGSHRVAYELHYGPIQPGMFVCHKCDNPVCCNPHHLFLGTIAENTEDMVRKSRQTRGEHTGNAKLEDNDIIEIRRLHKEGNSYRVLSRQFNVAISTIGSIVNYKSWKHIP